MDTTRKILNDLFCDDSGRLSLSKTILGIVTIIACVIMLKLTYNQQMSPEYFLIFLSFGTGHASLNKFLDTKRPKE